MARLKSEIFVSALLRRYQAQGLFATILRKGQADAGAIYIVVRARDAQMRLFMPADQMSYQEDAAERLFQERKIASELELSTFIEKESRFDPDFWLIEIEDDALNVPVDLVKPENPLSDFPF